MKEHHMKSGNTSSKLKKFMEWKRHKQQQTHCTLPVSTVLASTVWDGVQINKVIMRSNSQQTAICRHTERTILRFLVHFSHNVVKQFQKTQLTPPTYRKAHHRKLLVPISVDCHQVRGFGIQDIPPDTERPLRPSHVHVHTDGEISVIWPNKEVNMSIPSFQKRSSIGSDFQKGF